MAEFVPPGGNVLNQIALEDDALHREGGSACNGMRRVGVSVSVQPGTAPQCVDDAPVYQDPPDRLVAATQALGDHLNVRRNAFLLPCMRRARASHAAHYLV